MSQGKSLWNPGPIDTWINPLEGMDFTEELEDNRSLEEIKQDEERKAKRRKPFNTPVTWETLKRKVCGKIR